MGCSDTCIFGVFPQRLSNSWLRLPLKSYILVLTINNSEVTYLWRDILCVQGTRVGPQQRNAF